MARRHKKTLDPISLEELTNAPAMSGFVSFLNVKPWESEAVSDEKPRQVETTGVDSTMARITPDDHTVAAGSTVEPTPVETNPDGITGVVKVGGVSTPLEPTRVVSTASKLKSRPSDLTDLCESTAAVPTPVVSYIAATDSVFARRARIHEVRALPDSLSFGEEALYNALWANAVHHTVATRRITIGFERMSRIARLTDKNCKLNCRALIQKRVVEEIADTNFREGRTYLVHSPESALDRQRQAGLTHVIRTRGVVFIDLASGRELTTKQWRRRAGRVGTTGVVL